MRRKEIVLTEGSCSGKSSVLETLHKKGDSVTEEIVRDVLMEREDYEATRDEWAIVQGMIYSRQYLAESIVDGRIHFFDRGMMDAVVYSRMIIGDGDGAS